MPRRSLTDRETPRMLDAVSSTQDDPDDLQGLFPPPPPVSADIEAQRQFHRVRARLFGEEETPLMLGRWTIGDLIDVGGMGRVYKAFDPKLQREVAVKAMQFAAGTDVDRRRQRMLREAQAMAAVRHPNVVHVYDVEVSDVQVFVVMELVRGQTLSAWLNARARPWREIVDVFIAAGEGLAASHAVGVIHRDFKPDNVLIDGQGRVKVIDFGLACADGTSEGDPQRGMLAQPLTAEGAIVGTLNYSAPEQLRGEEVSARSDQFSFCRSLYEALYEVRPFVGDTSAELLEVMASSEPDFVGSRRVPRRLRAALRRGLSFSPGRRFADMHQLLDELRATIRPSIRRWIGLALVPVLGWFVCAPSAHPDVCQKLAARAADLQGAGRLARMGEAGQGIHLSPAVALWSQLELRWTRHVSSWWRASEALCLTAGARDHAYETRVACLLDHGWTLDALGDEFSRPTVDLVANLDMLLLDLDERLARCTSPAGVASSAQAPPRAKYVRGTLARSWAAEKAGKLRIARMYAEDALREAEESADAGLLAEAELQRGRILGRQRDPDARHALERARDLALGEGDPLVSFDAALFLYKFATEVLEDSTLAQRQAAWLRPLLRRVGDPPWRLAQLADARGLVLRFERDYKAAEAAHSEALALLGSLLGKDSPEFLRVELNLVTTRAEASGAGETELVSLYSDLLERVSRHLGERHPLAVSVGRELALTLHERGALEAAEAATLRALSVARTIYGEDSRDIAVLETLLARILLDDTRPTAAERYASSALARFEALTDEVHLDSTTVAALSVLGDVAFERGDYTRAEALYERGASLAERMEWQAPLRVLEMRNNAAYALYASGRSAEAAVRLASLAVQVEQLNLGHTTLAVNIHGNLGLARMAAGQPELARASLTRALGIADALGDPDLDPVRSLYHDALARFRADHRPR